MLDERDDLDEVLLEEGAHAELLAAYYPIVLGRLRIRVGPGAAYEVASDVCLRLLSELRRGRRYGVPYRVVVHMVTDWALRDWWRNGQDRPETPHPPQWHGWEGAVDGDPGPRTIEFDDWVRHLMDSLSPHDREIATMHFIDDVAIPEIAEMMGLTRNAVDQALHRARKGMRMRVDDE